MQLMMITGHTTDSNISRIFTLVLPASNDAFGLSSPRQLAETLTKG
jgi:hypothetical protein